MNLEKWKKGENYKYSKSIRQNHDLSISTDCIVLINAFDGKLVIRNQTKLIQIIVLISNKKTLPKFKTMAKLIESTSREIGVFLYLFEKILLYKTLSSIFGGTNECLFINKLYFILCHSIKKE
jgi:hypothetical protein